MRRLKGERFNPYGEWTEGCPVWELLDDVVYDADIGHVANALCVSPAPLDAVGEQHLMYVAEYMFPADDETNPVAFETKTGRLAP